MSAVNLEIPRGIADKEGGSDRGDVARRTHENCLGTVGGCVGIRDDDDSPLRELLGHAISRADALSTDDVLPPFGGVMPITIQTVRSTGCTIHQTGWLRFLQEFIPRTGSRIPPVGF